MKETNPIQAHDKIKVVDQREVQKQSKHIGSARIKPGQIMFEVNLVTGDIAPAEFTSVATFGGGVRKKIMVKENCHYLAALNQKNAMRKWMNILLPQIKK